MTEFNVGDKVVRVSDNHTLLGSSFYNNECNKGDTGVVKYISEYHGGVGVTWDNSKSPGSTLDPDNLELVKPEPIVKVQDRVQVKDGAKGFHESWYGVPGRVFDSPVGFEDEVDEEYPYILMFDEDDRQYVYIKNLNDLEPVPEPEPTVPDSETEDEAEKFVFILTKDDVVEQFSLKEVYITLQDKEIYLYDVATEDLVGFFPQDQFKYFTVSIED